MLNAKIFMLLSSYDDEGSSFLGVFSTIEAATEAAEATIADGCNADALTVCELEVNRRFPDEPGNGLAQGCNVAQWINEGDEPQWKRVDR